jgi:NAD+ diphosphatase
MEMNYCVKCGAPLKLKYHEHEGKDIPWCGNCGEFRYPFFNCAVSMIVMNEEKDKVYLIKQYGKDSYVLVAGYVNLGEDAEDAAVREVKEEMGLTVSTLHFNRSRYYPRTNTLMLNYTVTVKEHEPSPNWEIDSWKCFSIPEARASIRPGSLAQSFLNGYFDGEYSFT